MTSMVGLFCMEAFGLLSRGGESPKLSLDPVHPDTLRV